MIRAAFIAPCVGVGGADMVMLQLIKHAYNINWVGVAVGSPVANSDFVKNTTGPIYDTNGRSFQEAIDSATKDADIIITWCVALAGYGIDPRIPIIEYGHNVDKRQKEIIDSNKQIVTYNVACSDAVAKLFNSSVKVIYNGIDASRLTPRKGKTLQKEVWGIPASFKILSFIGRFVPEKRPADLIYTLQHLPENWVGLFVGSGELKSDLARTISEIVPGRVAFVEPQYHIGDILAASDCLLLHSDFEGHPLILMEAMLAGVPCVYSELEVMQDLHKKHGDMGWMVPHQVLPTEIATIVESAITNNQEQFVRLNTARSVVWSDYNIAAMAHNWEEHLEWCYFDWCKKQRLTRLYPVGKRQNALEK
jgi:glycosyltransferase involved in cell wall biosynthesis